MFLSSFGPSSIYKEKLRIKWNLSEICTEYKKTEIKNEIVVIN